MNFKSKCFLDECEDQAQADNRVRPSTSMCLHIHRLVWWFADGVGNQKRLGWRVNANPLNPFWHDNFWWCKVVHPKCVHKVTWLAFIEQVLEYMVAMCLYPGLSLEGRVSSLLQVMQEYGLMSLICHKVAHQMGKLAARSMTRRSNSSG